MTTRESITIAAALSLFAAALAGCTSQGSAISARESGDLDSGEASSTHATGLSPHTGAGRTVHHSGTAAGGLAGEAESVTFSVSSPISNSGARIELGRPADNPDLGRTANNAAAIDASIAALGESPIAMVLDALGPDVRRYHEHVTTLASPYFEGRAAGTEGNRRAADYIEFFYRQFGLKPAFAADPEPVSGDSNFNGDPAALELESFRQSVPTSRSARVIGQSVSLDAEAGWHTDLSVGKEYSVLGMSGDGTASGPIVFVSYGQSDGPEGYTSELTNADLSGKIALLLRFEPMDEHGKSRWSSSGWSARSSLDAKIAAVAARHPAAIMLVNPPGADDPRVNELADTRATIGDPAPMPVVMVRTEAADDLVRRSGLKQGDDAPTDLMTLRQFADRAGVVVDVPGVTASITAKLDRTSVTSDNVGAILPGKGDLADQFIIIGAHDDHVGYGSFGSRDRAGRGKLHPGADDNASGTVGVLMLAERLAREYAQMPEGGAARSILFLNFTGEEGGLIGSRFYVSHPAVPLDRTTIMINLDMIGRLREGKLELGGVGTAEGLNDWLKPYIDGSGLTVAAKPGGFGPSDHASFSAAKRPVLFFFTGLHERYHMPTDFGWTVNQAGAVRVIELIHDITLGLAMRPEAMPYADQGRGAESAATGDQPTFGRVSVRFGIAPGDYSGSDPGVLVGEVTEGTSAAEAGIKAGDRLIRWNGKELTTVESWMPMLARAKPGDEVEIVYVRDGQEMTTRATLKPREQTGR